jgi:oligoribonuclease NrnB/cAMP/cGMP phosphodiesterase (DHH superfamily)
MIYLNVFNSRRIGSWVSILSFLISFAFATSSNATTTMQGRRAAAKEVVSKLVAEDFEGVRANFNATMKQGLSAEQMKDVWKKAIAYHGEYKSQGEARNAQQDGYDVYAIRCEMKNSPMEVVVAYDSDGKIGGLWVHPATQ